MKAGARKLVVGMVAVVALSSISWAGDAWKDKKPADWSAKEMQKFLTNSPWARTVQPSMNQMSTDHGPTTASTGGWGGGPGGGGGGGGQWGGGGGGNASATPIMTFQVRWVSAPIMREALKVSESEAFNSAIERYAKDYYVVSVTMQVAGAAGVPTKGSRGGWSGGGAPSGGGGGQWGAPGAGQAPSKEQEEARKRFQEMLIRGATLNVAGKAVHPERAEMTPCKAGMATLYLFPRSLRLEDVEKDYVFEVTQGPSVTRANFSFKGFEQAPEKGM